MAFCDFNELNNEERDEDGGEDEAAFGFGVSESGERICTCKCSRRCLKLMQQIKRKRTSIEFIPGMRFKSLLNWYFLHLRRE